MNTNRNTKLLSGHVTYKKLSNLTKNIHCDEHHLKHLIAQENRLQNFSLKAKSFFFDFSKQRITKEILDNLILLSKERRAKELFKEMATGKTINVTENRAALHTATRDFSNSQDFYDNPEIIPQIKAVNNKIKSFTEALHQGKIKGGSNKPFTDAVIVGIGGSYLGCEFAYNALKYSVTPIINLHFLPNVDIDNFGEVIKSIDPETCLWIVISKSYTTTETMANLSQALMYMKNNNIDPNKQLVTITSKGSPGDDPKSPGIDSFHMFDFIGGRYSVTSAVGGLPLSLAFGYDTFEQFLNGCHIMDQHALNETESENIPLVAALLSIWNSNFLDYPAQAIIPYCSALSKLAPHIQQLYMESIGKSVTKEGKNIDYPAGVIIFGEPGTNAQHSFFQFAHQGSPFPIEFIGVVNPVYDGDQTKSKGVYNHQELWANMIAQGKALAIGKEDNDTAKCFIGNRPSSTILINDLSPESIGMLLSFYEARTVFEGFILGINPFDQYGVELGKNLASNIRAEFKQKNENENYEFDSQDFATRFYLETLYKGTLS